MKEEMLTDKKVLIRSLVKPSARNKQKTGMKKGISRVFYQNKTPPKGDKNPLNFHRKTQGFAEIYTYL